MMALVPRSVRAILTSVLLLIAAASAAAAPAAPAFSAKLLDSNRTVDSRDLIGKKVVVLRFQASWCKPCVKESAALSRIAERYRDRGVEVIAFHVQDTAADVRRFMRANRVGYPVALDPTLVIGNRFGVKGTPYTAVIDRKGEIIARIVGQSAPTRLPKILDETLRQAAKPSRKL